MTKKNKNILTGIFVGLIANVFGLIFAIQIFGASDDYLKVIKDAIAENVFGKLVAMGALLNLGAFFVFIKKSQDHRAMGVLILTVIVMLITFGLKFLS
jgi:hypothetical protein